MFCSNFFTFVKFYLQPNHDINEVTFIMTNRIDRRICICDLVKLMINSLYKLEIATWIWGR